MPLPMPAATRHLFLQKEDADTCIGKILTRIATSASP